MHYFSVFELSHWHTFNLFNTTNSTHLLLMTLWKNKSLWHQSEKTKLEERKGKESLMRLIHTKT